MQNIFIRIVNEMKPETLLYGAFLTCYPSAISEKGTRRRANRSRSAAVTITTSAEYPSTYTDKTFAQVKCVLNVLLNLFVPLNGNGVVWLVQSVNRQLIYSVRPDSVLPSYQKFRIPRSAILCCSRSRSRSRIRTLTCATYIFSLILLPSIESI